jgi:uncharacterized protein YyaL (SSP411 family)
VNRLANESSPYLLQHGDNPVDWYPWGDEALQLAKDKDKPILLSIGYAACHWCHVMAHESFENPATAALMNEHFVNIKVDREERPDLDSIYMDAVVAMTGQGGWPMTVALTPDGQPFFGGTYYPPQPRYGMPSFTQVLQTLNDAWHNRREDVLNSAAQLSGQVSRSIALQGQAGILQPALLEQATRTLAQTFDAQEGGFGGAPKFPPAMTIEFLLRQALRAGDRQAQHMAEFTLKKMAYGGMYDQVGGGFARYSVDHLWLVPHFEKMLYDNAQLARVYLHAWQVTGHPLYRRVAEETLDYVLREMQHKDGGFYSSLDADSEGVEGKFYVWTAAETQAILGDQAGLFMAYYDVTESGNWEGKNILHINQEPVDAAAAAGLSLEELESSLATARQTLYEYRAQRVWPGLDDKVLTAWNGLMMAAFAEAGRALERSDYLAAAQSNARFLYDHMRTGDGRLLRTWKAGSQAKYNAYLEDYAYLAEGLLALYQSDFDPRWFSWARELADVMLVHFHDPANGGFFDTSDDHERLIHRPKDLQDNAVPSGNAVAATVLLKLSLFTGEGHYWEVAEGAIAGLYNALVQAPVAFGQWLQAAAFILGEPREVAITGDPKAAGGQALLNVVNDAFRPFLVVAAGSEAAGETVPLLANRPQIDGQATAYVCRRFLCQAPVTEPEALAAQLAGD